MLLAHQKPVLPPMSPTTFHRRHPSAPPAVVVQPTKVPGILSVAKPLQHHSQAYARHPHRTPKAKLAPPHPRTAHALQDVPAKLPQDVRKRSADPVPEKPAAHPPAPHQDKSSRGRQTKTPKDKAATRSSSTHGHSRRNNVRQPSPPIHASQVEGPTLPSAQSCPRNPASNSFDPFLVSSDSDSDANPRPPFPPASGPPQQSLSLTPPPAGKSRRRIHTAQPPATPSPAPRPVPVPRGKQSSHRGNLSRSAPNLQAHTGLDRRRASAGHVMNTGFPVCDDTTDVEDNSLPSTPTREFPAGSTWHLDGPRTAPLSFNTFSFDGTVDSTPSRTRHHRTPSEGVFSMSLDEDISSTFDTSGELKKLFGFPPKKFGSVGHNAFRAGKDKGGFFASSVFQNSPSPDELPPPAF